MHCRIDGYSRLIVYLHVSTNNCAGTVFHLFLKATQEFGVSSRVRSDKGGENVDVCYFMIMHRGAGRGSHIAGSSTHNQRIERLWCDIYRVCSLFHSLFHYMEAIGVLNPADESDLFVLHSVFLPRINNALHEFALAWNLHPMRSMHNLSPKRVFYCGDLDDSSAMGVQDSVDSIPLGSLVSYGVSLYSSQLTEVQDDNEEVVPNTPSLLLSDQHEELLHSFNALEERDDYGIGLYTSSRETLSRIISAN